MNRKNHTTWLSCHCLGGWLFVCAAANVATGELTFEPSWELPEYRAVRQQVLDWVQESRFAAEQRTQARSLWPSVDLRSADGSDLLQRVADTFVVVDERAQQLVAACNAEFQGPVPPEGDWLRDETVPDFVRNNLSLYYARWLAQRGLYDEVVAALEGLEPDDVVDPAGLLFYRTIAHQQLVEPELSRIALVRLLEHEDALPRRYQQVAQLLRRDLAGLKDESLDHIARRMSDVRRRLEFGRAGKQVQMVEKGVVDSLDKLIKKLEEQQQQQAAGASSGQQSAKPMQDSQLPGMRAPMQVEQRDIGSKSGWGDLPPKEREQALQQIGREFPGHYRDLIEQYFRELADETNSPPSR
jgi:hypothetical protein